MVLIEQITSHLTKRRTSLFAEDYANYFEDFKKSIGDATILVIGGAGSIGQAFIKELVSFQPSKIDICDLSENNLVELIRDLRSSNQTITAELNTYALDYRSPLFQDLVQCSKSYDYIVNFSALKHVRSEQNIFSLLNMCHTNFVGLYDFLKFVRTCHKPQKFFSVSTDKSVNPANLMGATKRLMEQVMFSYAECLPVSSARFANVAFSDGSLLHGFINRFRKQQPLAGPTDIKRYFISFQEAGQLCMLSTFVGKTKEIFFPKLDEQENLIGFQEIAELFLQSHNLKPYYATDLQEAKQSITDYMRQGLYPCYFTASETTGEKPYEEFINTYEHTDLETYQNIGVIKFSPTLSVQEITHFVEQLKGFQVTSPQEDKASVVALIANVVQDLNHIEKNMYLDAMM